MPGQRFPCNNCKCCTKNSNALATATSMQCNAPNNAMVLCNATNNALMQCKATCQCKLPMQSAHAACNAPMQGDATSNAPMQGDAPAIQQCNAQQQKMHRCHAIQHASARCKCKVPMQHAAPKQLMHDGTSCALATQMCSKGQQHHTRAKLNIASTC